MRYFLAVAEELHFGRAALRLHISQPPLSQQIRELESELGVRLFVRTSRSVRLTAAGAAFCDQVRQLFGQLERAVSQVQSIDRGEAGRLGVGFCAPAMEGPLPLRLKAFNQRFPSVQLDLQEARTPELIEALQLDRLDLGFVRLFQEHPDGLETQLFFSEPYLLAVPEGHRLCVQKSVNIQDLDGEPVLMVPQGAYPKLYAAFETVFRNAEVRIRIAREVGSKQTMAALTVAGEGLCFLPASMRKFRREGLRLLPVSGEFPLVEIYMCWRKNTASRLLQNFMDLMRSPGATKGTA